MCSFSYSHTSFPLSLSLLQLLSGCTIWTEMTKSPEMSSYRWGYFPFMLSRTVNPGLNPTQRCGKEWGFCFCHNGLTPGRLPETWLSKFNSGCDLICGTFLLKGIVRLSAANLKKEFTWSRWLTITNRPGMKSFCICATIPLLVPCDDFWSWQLWWR